MNDFRLGVVVARERLRPWGPLAWVVLGALAFTLLVAYSSHHFVGEGAVNWALSEPIFGWAIPLSSFAIVSRVIRKSRVHDALSEEVRYGADRRLSALGLVLGAALAATLLSAILSCLGAFVAHGGGGVLDALNCAWIGGLGGAAYAAWFFLGGTFGRRGGGRYMALFVDWVLGATTSGVSLPWPRAHLQSLLGGECVAGFSQSQSTAALWGLTALYLLATLIRLPP